MIHWTGARLKGRCKSKARAWEKCDTGLSIYGFRFCCQVICHFLVGYFCFGSCAPTIFDTNLMPMAELRPQGAEAWQGKREYLIPIETTYFFPAIYPGPPNYFQVYLLLGPVIFKNISFSTACEFYIPRYAFRTPSFCKSSSPVPSSTIAPNSIT